MLRTVLAVAAASLMLTATADAAQVPLPRGGYSVVQDEQAVTTGSDDLSGELVDVAASRILSSTTLTRVETAHAVGHIVDWQYLTDADRAYVSKFLGAPKRDWFDYRNINGDGAEYFADYYAAVATGLDPRPRHLKGGGVRVGQGHMTYATVTYRRLNRFRWFLAGIAAREGLRVGAIRSMTY